MRQPHSQSDSFMTMSPRHLPSASEEPQPASISSAAAAGQAVACHLHCQAVQCRHLQNLPPAVSVCWVCCQAVFQAATQAPASSWLPLPAIIACKQIVTSEVC